MQLPVAFGPSWFLHEFRSDFLTTAPAAGGLATAELRQVPQDERWLLDRVVVQCTSTTQTVAFLYLNETEDRGVLDGTRVGNFDVADQSQPILLEGGARLIVQWRGASNGAIGHARLQLRILKQAS
ncbi:hypothetical protein F9L07_19895 [Pimelobacter simplex]|uniref:Uncharacterized protein n=1 Tax=Nocardioides simplex TaxID=2045 RepID=A0A7J5DVM0_NOCSI|nr:hypothetical protein [Pimelobacter simplex]KAB2809305.1 hypothetical protein F9L07_19895 [Pimelobacter simplex]